LAQMVTCCGASSESLSRASSGGVAGHMFDIDDWAGVWSARLARIPEHGRNLFDSAIGPTLLGECHRCLVGRLETLSVESGGDETTCDHCGSLACVACCLPLTALRVGCPAAMVKEEDERSAMAHYRLCLAYGRVADGSGPSGHVCGVVVQRYAPCM
jgi:hypothetical protein